MNCLISAILCFPDRLTHFLKVSFSRKLQTCRFHLPANQRPKLSIVGDFFCFREEQYEFVLPMREHEMVIAQAHYKPSSSGQCAPKNLDIFERNGLHPGTSHETHVSSYDKLCLVHDFLYRKL